MKTPPVLLFAVFALLLAPVPDAAAQVPAQGDPLVSQYAGPFYPVTSDPRVYRTRMASLSNVQTQNEFTSDQAVLVGFDVTGLGAASVTGISSMTPIYETGGERKLGGLIGTVRGNVSSLAARPGYGVATLEVWPALIMAPQQGRAPAMVQGFSGVRVTFARLENGKLSATDRYVSPLVGFSRLNPVVLDTNGVPSCGVVAAYTVNPCSLGLLLSTRVVAQSAPGLIPSPGNPGQSAAAATPPAAMGQSPVVAFPRMAAPSSLGFPQEATALGDSRIADISSRVSKSFAFVQGDSGKGSAFIATYQGRRKVFSNQHVVRENPGMRFMLLNQGLLKLGASHAAVGHDLIMMDAEEALPSLEIELDCAANVAIGDDVVVIGNTEGQGVIQALPGKIAGIGPNLLEVTSQFKPGNSGSPIIHVASGRVIGVATFAIVRSVDSLTGDRGTNVRRFGYRIDSVKDWQPVQWRQYQAEAEATAKVSAFSNTLMTVLADLKNRRFNPSTYNEPRLNTAFGFIQPVVTRPNMSMTDARRGVQNFLGELKNLSTKDVDALVPRVSYDYFKRELADEMKFRAELSKALGEAVNRLR